MMIVDDITLADDARYAAMLPAARYSVDDASVIRVQEYGATYTPPPLIRHTPLILRVAASSVTIDAAMLRYAFSGYDMAVIVAYVTMFTIRLFARTPRSSMVINIRRFIVYRHVTV